jgi:hypothetical protein
VKSAEVPDTTVILAGLRVPLPLAGSVIFAAIRLLSLAIVGFLLRHGKFQVRHWSLAQWITSWDAKFYLLVATRGYGFHWQRPLPNGSLYPWFPGYPAAIASIAWIPGVSAALAGFIVTIGAGLSAAWGLTRLSLRLTGEPRVSLLIVAIWASAPSAIVFSMVYTEALYCAFAIWALYALTGRRWLTAAALTLAAGAVQSSAAALIVAVSVAALGSVIYAVRTGQRISVWWRPLAAVVLAPLGLLGYWGFVAVQTRRLDGWFWIEKAAWHQSFDWGRGTLENLAQAVLGQVSLPSVLLVLVIGVALVLAVMSLTEPAPAFLHAFTIAGTVLALGTTSTYLCSKPRFLLAVVLLAFPLARVLARVRTSLLVPLIAVIAAATTWFGLYQTVIAWLPPLELISAPAPRH